MEKQRLIKYYFAVGLVIVLFAGSNNAVMGEPTTPPRISPAEVNSPVSTQSNASQDTNSDNMLPLLLSILALAVSGGAIALSILKNRKINERIELNNEKYSNKLKLLEDKYTELLNYQTTSSANQPSEVSSREFRSFNNNNIYLEASIEALSERVNTLENKLKAAQSSNSSIEFSKNYSSNQLNDLETDINPFSQSTDIFPTDLTQPLENLAYIELVNTYNTNPKLLEQKAIKVSEPTDSINRRHTDSSQKIILEKANNSNYWVIHDDVGIDYWLLPKSKLKIDQYRYETTKALFECNGYQAEYSSFKLVKPAKVIPLSADEQTWQLEEPGILEFSVEA